MSKHTPGPWVVDAHTVGRYKGVNIENVLGYRIASAGHSMFNLDEKQANAHLIAAAPELLDAAKWAVGMCSNEVVKLHQMMKTEKPDIGESPDPKYIQIFIDHWELIRKKCQAAVDKAEGKS